MLVWHFSGVCTNCYCCKKYISRYRLGQSNDHIHNIFLFISFFLKIASVQKHVLPSCTSQLKWLQRFVSFSPYSLFKFAFFQSHTFY